MIRRVVTAALAVALLAAGGGCASPSQVATPIPRPTIDPVEAIYRLVVRSCAAAQNGEAVATGVAVARGRIVTVAHTFRHAASLTIYDADGTTVPAVLTVLDDERDLAIIDLLDDRTASDDSVWWLPLAPVDDGSTAIVLTAAGETITAKPATVVRQLDVTIDGVGLRAGLELTADIDPGDSGAPVVTTGDRVAGIVFATDRDEPRGWAIAASEIDAALAQPTGGPISLDCQPISGE